MKEKCVKENILLYSFSSVLDKYDFYFMPLINPDGYQFSRTSDRLWRKVLSNVFPNVLWKLFGSQLAKKYYRWLRPSP